jgi:nitrite reductase/ring-hydroxylating ferredoxin subunit
MADGERLICRSEDVADGGLGFKFPIVRHGREAEGFVVRFQGRVHAYVNECSHTPVELDWNNRNFFDTSGLYLICATHGALFAPDTGACLGGRCDGRGLVKLDVAERDGNIYLIEAIHGG